MAEQIASSVKTLGGRYEIGELLGRGGMAEVHLGLDTRLDRKVAIKLLKPELSANPDFRVRFRQEAQAAARMSHPTIVRVFDAGEEPAKDSRGNSILIPYIVMEYVDGRLVKEIYADGPLSESEAIRITKGILTALEYSHRAGIVHRDIKPGNIMVTPGGQVKVMDFGIARAVSETSATVAQTGAILGTAQYFSPEQARGEVVDARSDLYSTGIVLFELLTGRPPFRADTAVAVAYQHVSEPPPVPSELVPGISPAMDSVVLKALTKSKRDRFASAAEFQEALDDSKEGIAIPVEDAETTLFAPAAATSATRMFEELGDEEYTPNAQSRPPIAWIWGGIAVIGVLVFAIVFWAIQQGPNLPIAGLSVDVPDIVGVEEATALETISEAGLAASVSRETNDAPVGEVLRTEPTAGVPVSPGTSIRVVISNGPPPIPLPNMTGLTIDQATNLLETEGLALGAVNRIPSASVPEGVVIRTDPSADTSTPIGTEIDVFVSNGRVTIPNVVGMSYSSAASMLTADDIGYTVRRIILQSCMGGRVTAQSIAPGEQPQGGTITLTYCGGQPPPPPQPSNTPDPTTPPVPDPAPPAPPGDNGNGNDED
ncbi:Stk1 family PASTA domain-containing Ser/Thr kinase [Humidisolicoccus flavus]|uniref:Stk1 family PASTA domain-containing Ser/Thr kinase n=1 Tax=Humidisolicoccus flavus TaxID=3111414 RepID=UPI00324FF9F8